MKHLLTICLCTLFSLAQAQNALNVTFKDSLQYPSLVCNDVWAYVDSSGNEYAIFGTIIGEVIADVTDPNNIEQLSFTFGPFSLWRDFKVFGDYAYVSNETDLGIRIFDLRGLPDSVTFKDTIIQGVSTIHNLWIDDSGYLYAVGCNQFNGGAMILDLNQDPWNPNFVGVYDDRYVHDIYVRGDLGYSAEIDDGLLTILDLSDRTNPQVLGSTDYINSFTHNTWLNDAGDVVFTTDELNDAFIYAWDITDPTNITQLGSFRSPLSNGTAVPHNVHVLNDFLVISYYKDGLVIVDASHPDNLVMTGYYDTTPEEGGEINGAWGAYPFLPSGNVLVTDMAEGFFVLEPNYQRAGFVDGIVSDANSNTPISDVAVVVKPALEDRSTDMTGRWAYGTADYGTYSAVFSKYGYEPDSLNFDLQANMEVDGSIALTPTPRLDLTILAIDAETQQAIPDAQISLVPDSGDVIFSGLTDLVGSYQANDFVANSYELVVGKWGYRSKGLDLDLAPGNQIITVELEAGFYDDFALEFGWTAEINGMENRGWERAIPAGTDTLGETIAPNLDLNADFGQLAFVTDNTAGQAEVGDVDNAELTLTSPMMDLSGYHNPMLRFHYWLTNFNPANGNQGSGSLKVALKNDLISIDILTYEAALDNQWNLVDSVELFSLFPLNMSIQVQFIAKGGLALDLMEAGIDGFEVFGKNPPTAIESPLSQSEFQVYPTPTKGSLHLEYQLPPLAAAIISLKVDVKFSRRDAKPPAASIMVLIQLAAIESGF
ncbi:MAG: choice-of-anchor B family protein, partial [Bacteroidota bacterium]